MKYVILTSARFNPSVGGVENSIFHLSECYSKMGYRPIILTSNAGDLHAKNKKKLFTVLKNNKNIIIKYRYSRIFLIRLLLSFLCFKWVSKRHTIETCICRDEHFAFATIFSNIRSIYLIPGIGRWEGSHAIDLQLFRRLNYLGKNLFQETVIKNVTHIGVFSLNMKRQIIALKRYKNVHRFLPGISAERFFNVTQNDQSILKAELGLDHFQSLLCYVGRFTKVKNLPVLLQSLSYLDDKIGLVMVGDGPELKNIKTLVANLDLNSRVKFVGRSTKPEIYFQASDLFVLPSTYEPFGQVLIEAMACGKPIVGLSNSCQGVKNSNEEIIPEDFRFMAAENTPKAFADQIGIAIGKSIDSNKISSWAQEKFSWKTLAAGLLRDFDARQEHHES